MYHKHNLYMTRSYCYNAWNGDDAKSCYLGTSFSWKKKSFWMWRPCPLPDPHNEVVCCLKAGSIFFLPGVLLPGGKLQLASGTTPGTLCKTSSRISDFWDGGVWNVSWKEGHKWCIWMEISRTKSKRKLLTWFYSKITKQSEVKKVSIPRKYHDCNNANHVVLWLNEACNVLTHLRQTDSRME